MCPRLYVRKQVAVGRFEAVQEALLDGLEATYFVTRWEFRRECAGGRAGWLRLCGPAALPVPVMTGADCGPVYGRVCSRSETERVEAGKPLLEEILEDPQVPRRGRGCERDARRWLVKWLDVCSQA